MSHLITLDHYIETALSHDMIPKRWVDEFRSNNTYAFLTAQERFEKVIQVLYQTHPTYPEEMLNLMGITVKPATGRI